MVAFPADPTIRPLPIWYPQATGADLERLKAVYLSLAIPGKVRPVEAVPGSPGPILAIASKPDWACDYAPISGMDSPGLAYAMRCIITDEWDTRMKSITDWLNESPLGPGIVEVEQETLQADGTWKKEEVLN